MRAFRCVSRSLCFPRHFASLAPLADDKESLWERIYVSSKTPLVPMNESYSSFESLASDVLTTDRFPRMSLGYK